MTLHAARTAVRTAQRARDDAQRRVNVCQELADSQAHAIARRGSDCPPAFFVIYQQRDERLSKAVEVLRAARRDVSAAQQVLAEARRIAVPRPPHDEGRCRMTGTRRVYGNALNPNPPRPRPGGDR